MTAISGAQVVVFSELHDAYNTVRCETGRTPKQIIVVPTGDPTPDCQRDEAWVTEEAWRHAVRVTLKDMHGFWPRDPILETFMRRPGWKFRDVPVNTLLLR